MANTQIRDPADDMDVEDEAQEICRTCLMPSDEVMRSIFKRGQICGQITRLSDMLAHCTKLEVSDYFQNW